MTTAGVPSGWKDDGKTLLAPNGVPVVRGMRDFVLGYAEIAKEPGGWEADNLPLGPEYQTGQIEPGNASMGGGSRQDFRWRSLGCQQRADGTWGSAYTIWVGQDVRALTHQLDVARAHIADLEKQLANQPPTPAPVPVADPKAMEALTALVELAKALRLVGAVDAT